MHSKRKTVLTIAGSDCSGGAGIQADLKTLLANGVYGMSAMTALTAQNTTGVTAISEVTPLFLGQQLDAVFTDIFPDAVKIGMTANQALMEVIVQRLRFYNAKNIVVDPVMIATSGAKLLSLESVAVLQKKLLPIARVITPNLPEAEVLCGMHISNRADMEAAAIALHKAYGCSVLLKGGHCTENADDLLLENGEITWFFGQRIQNPNTHGTGCTLSAAIAANLAKGCELPQAVQLAKQYLSGAISAMLDLGAGSGPLDHGFGIPPLQL
ncbi:MAG: bifunctional hydroxymethylpyrimidine kinase/phosphomethylpyrimidine kinase [Ruminococcus sp.]|nr:bifunctional hydroxymethylpyrimidine kinase/phosphomethylpyrimidine kinase [Ruminococcus sp.]